MLYIVGWCDEICACLFCSQRPVLRAPWTCRICLAQLRVLLLPKLTLNFDLSEFHQPCESNDNRYCHQHW